MIEKYFNQVKTILGNAIKFLVRQSTYIKLIGVTGLFLGTVATFVSTGRRNRKNINDIPQRQELLNNATISNDKNLSLSIRIMTDKEVKIFHHYYFNFYLKNKELATNSQLKKYINQIRLLS